MKILILGHSSLVKRKIIPSLHKIDKIKDVEIASLSDKNIPGVSKIYSDYENALEATDAQIVYISLPNSLHFKYLKKSIEQNKHVIVDKPFLINSREYSEIQELLETSSSFVFESNVFTFHSGWKKFKELALINSDKGSLVANFSIPELAAENFRNFKKMGGGAFNDMGPYAASIGLKFWESDAKNIYINKKIENGLISSFSVIANYGENKNLVGKFSFNESYSNYIAFKSKNTFLYLMPAFSSPENMIVKILKLKNNEIVEIQIKTDNTFKNFIEESIKTIEDNEFLKSRNSLYNSVNEFFAFKQVLK
jgi:NDP-hexose-3-ketoreductase